MAAIGRQATCSRAISNIKLHGVVFGIDDGGALGRRPWKQRGRGRVEVGDLGRRGAEPRRDGRVVGADVQAEVAAGMPCR